MQGEKFNNPYIDKLVGIPQKYRNQEDTVNQDLVKFIEQRGSKKIGEFELEKTLRDVEISY